MHHCMMTSMLDDVYFPNKPSTWLLFNCAPQTDVKCFNRCANRLSDPNALNFHRVLICNRDDKHPDQIVLRDELEKSRIPAFGVHAMACVTHHGRFTWISSNILNLAP